VIENRNRKNILRGLEEIAARLDLRLVEGISERVVFREFFLRGLTALDTLDKETLGIEPTMSHLSARREITRLIDSLRLPTKSTGRRLEPEDQALGHGQGPAEVPQSAEESPRPERP
jgi:chromosome partitioning protein